LIGSFLLPIYLIKITDRRFLYYFSVYVNLFKELFLYASTLQAIRLIS